MTFAKRSWAICVLSALVAIGCDEAASDDAEDGGGGAAATTGSGAGPATGPGTSSGGTGTASTAGTSSTGSSNTTSTGGTGGGLVGQPIDPNDIFAQADASETFESHGWVIAHECAGQTGTFENLPESGIVGSDLGDQYGTLRFGKVDAPEDPMKKVFAFHVNRNDPELFGAPRCEVTWASSDHDTRIPINEEFWFAFGLHLPNWTVLPEQGIIAQWHESGPTVNPFMAFAVEDNRVKVTLRYNADSSPQQSGNTVIPIELDGDLPIDEWTYFVVKAKISWDASDNPYFHVWRDGELILEYNDRLGYNSSATPFMKFGFYPWGYDTPANMWTPSVPTKTLLFRQPTYVHDTQGTYEELDLRAHVAGN